MVLQGVDVDALTGCLKEDVMMAGAEVVQHQNQRVCFVPDNGH